MEEEEKSEFVDFNGSYEELCGMILQKQCLVVVIFAAPWCPPCRKLRALLPEIVGDYQNVTFVMANTDEAKELVTHYCIRSIPHIKFFKAAPGEQIQELASVSGADLPQIKAKLAQYNK